MGIITADSGLSGGSATVFLIKIDEYDNIDSEGIEEIIEVPFEEMQQCVQNGEINDGYTLAAYALYLSHIKQKSATHTSI